MATDDITVFDKILSDNGYRITSARRTTFELLRGAEPQSIKVLLEKAKGKVDRVSIYRNIELFEKLGIVNRIYVGWKYRLELSDDFVAHHHHMTCLSCGDVVEIKDEEHIDSFIEEVARQASFTPRRHIFEIDGICSHCLKVKGDNVQIHDKNKSVVK